MHFLQVFYIPQKFKEKNNTLEMKKLFVGYIYIYIYIYI